MHDFPRQKLQELIQRYGADLCKEPKRCEALLRDACRGEYRREVFGLMNALKEGAMAELLNLPENVPVEGVRKRLGTRLHEHLGLDHKFADWVVESWILAIRQTIHQDKRAASATSHSKARKPRSNLKKQASAKAGYRKAECPRCQHVNQIEVSKTSTICTQCRVFFYIPIKKEDFIPVSDPPESEWKIDDKSTKILNKKQASPKENYKEAICPKCQHLNRVEVSKDYVICTHCHVFFYIPMKKGEMKCPKCQHINRVGASKTFTSCTHCHDFFTSRKNQCNLMTIKYFKNYRTLPESEKKISYFSLVPTVPVGMHTASFQRRAYETRRWKSTGLDGKSITGGLPPGFYWLYLRARQWRRHQFDFISFIEASQNAGKL